MIIINIKEPVLEKKLEIKVKGMMKRMKPRKICKNDLLFSIEKIMIKDIKRPNTEPTIIS